MQHSIFEHFYGGWTIEDKFELVTELLIEEYVQEMIIHYKDKDNAKQIGQGGAIYAN